MTPSHRFQLFIQRADDLEDSRFLKSSKTWDWGVTLGVPEGEEFILSYSTEDSITAEYRLPNENSADEVEREILQVRLPDRDDVDAFLLRFRRFVAQGDELHLPVIYNLAERCIADGWTKDALRKSRKQFNYAMETNYPTNVQLTGKYLTPKKYAVDLWLQGHVFHDNEEKRKELGLDTMTEAFRNAVIVQFTVFALNVSGQVLLVRNLLKRAFRLRLVSCSCM